MSTEATTDGPGAGPPSVAPEPQNVIELIQDRLAIIEAGRTKSEQEKTSEARHRCRTYVVSLAALVVAALSAMFAYRNSEASRLNAQLKAQERGVALRVEFLRVPVGRALPPPPKPSESGNSGGSGSFGVDPHLYFRLVNDGTTVSLESIRLSYVSLDGRTQKGGVTRTTYKESFDETLDDTNRGTAKTPEGSAWFMGDLPDAIERNQGYVLALPLSGYELRCGDLTITTTSGKLFVFQVPERGTEEDETQHIAVFHRPSKSGP